MDRLIRIGAALVVVLSMGCRERAQAVQGEAELKDVVHHMMPMVAQTTGLRFKREPLVLRRTRDQVRDYLIHKIDEDMPPAELAGLQSALRLFGLIPDTLQLRPTMINVLTEQIAGYYDPDSNALYIPADIEPYQLRIVVSHELVHALQDQYVKLDSIITQRHANDRRSAAQAVLEGQATLAQIPVLMPEQRPDTLPLGWFWQQRAAMAAQQAQMKQFAHAPLWVREGLIFPYLGGADFNVWFRHKYVNRSVLDSMPTRLGCCFSSCWAMKSKRRLSRRDGMGTATRCAVRKAMRSSGTAFGTTARPPLVLRGDCSARGRNDGRTVGRPDALR